MKSIFAPICLTLLLCSGQFAFGQAEKAKPYAERAPIDWFSEAANYRSDTLLVKSLQFTAPYAGQFFETSAERNGHVFSGGISSFSTNASQAGTLDPTLLSQLRLMLAELHFPAAQTPIEPKPGQLHTAFIYFDGIAYRRLNYNGELPGEVTAILEIIKRELTASGKLRDEQSVAHHKLMAETYGDWKNRDGITVPTSNRERVFKDNNGLLLGLWGNASLRRRLNPRPYRFTMRWSFIPAAVSRAEELGGIGATIRCPGRELPGRCLTLSTPTTRNTNMNLK